MSRAATRDEAAKRFWADVKDLLTAEYGHAARRAQQAIDQYKQEVAPRLGEVVYNQGEKQAAKAIDGIIRNGLPWPSIATSANPP